MSDEELVVTKGLVERSFITSALMIMMALMMMALIMMILAIMMTKRILMMMMMLTMMPMMMKKLVSLKDCWSPRQRVRAIPARCDCTASWTWQDNVDPLWLLCQVTFYISWRDDQIPLQEGSVLFTEGKTVSSKPCEFYQPGIGRCRVERDWKNATFKDRDEDIDNKCLTSDCKNCNFRGHIAKWQTSFFCDCRFWWNKDNLQLSRTYGQPSTRKVLTKIRMTYPR